jgi:hypothetical protein
MYTAADKKQYRHYSITMLITFLVKIQRFYSTFQTYVRRCCIHLPTYYAPVSSQGHDPFISNMPRLEVCKLITTRTIKTVK